MSSGAVTAVPEPARGGNRAGRLLMPALLLLLLGALVLIALRTTPQGMDTPFDPDSAAGGGHRALRLWFEEQDYQVADTRATTFTIPADAHLLIISPADTAWTDHEADEVLTFVEEGGTVAVIHPAPFVLREALQLADSTWRSVDITHQSQPLLPGAPVHWTTDSSAQSLLPNDSDRAVGVLSHDDDTPTLLVQAEGAGWIWQLSEHHPLTNGSLAAEPEQAAIATALLRSVPTGGTVVFDGYHLFGPLEVEGIHSLQDWLYRTAAGRATLLALLLCGLYLVSAGRRLGPSLPLQHDVRRREAAEYVRAMAGLKRRAGALEETAGHQRRRLKHGIARKHGLAPGAAAGATTAADAEFVRLLHHTEGLAAAEIAAVERLLGTLHPPCDELTVVRAATEIDRLLGLRTV